MHVSTLRIPSCSYPYSPPTHAEQTQKSKNKKKTKKESSKPHRDHHEKQQQNNTGAMLWR
jgi:hypothetical protein